MKFGAPARFVVKNGMPGLMVYPAQSVKTKTIKKMKTQNFKPILFSTEKVQAILDGRTTQTRRVIYTEGINLSDFYPGNEGIIKQNGYFEFILKTNFEKAISFKPKYQKGDILWVRETWQRTYDGKLNKWNPIYRTDGGYWYDDEGPLKWKPSIHMPREAARIFLKVTDVRVERLQDITRGDAMAEGCPFPNMAKGDNPKDWFQSLWQKINGKKHPWDSKIRKV